MVSILGKGRQRVGRFAPRHGTPIYAPLPSEIYTPPSPDYEDALGANMKLWLDGDLGTDLSAGSVRRWIDQSGAGNHTDVQATASARPEYLAAGANGHGLLRFDAAFTQHLLMASGFAGIDAGDRPWFLAVLASPTFGQGRTIFEFGPAAPVINTNTAYLFYHDGVPVLSARQEGIGNPTLPVTIPDLVMIEIGYDGANTYLRLNDGAPATAASASGLPESITQYALAISVTGALNIPLDLALLLVCKAQPNSDARDTVRAMVNEKYELF